MSGAAFVLGNLWAISASLVAAELFMARRSAWRKTLAAAAGYPIVVYATLMVLGNLGLLTPGAVVTVAAAGLLAAGILFARLRTRPTRAETTGPEPANTAADAKGPWRPMALALFGGMVAVYVAATCVLGTNFHWDDRWFHAATPARWLIEQRFFMAPIDFHTYYPYNAELLTLWLMLPFRSDAMVSLAGLYWVGLLLTAMMTILFTRGADKPTMLLVGALVLASPAVLAATRTCSAAEIAGTALILAAVAFVATPAAVVSRRARMADFGYAGLLSGLATGCKVTFAPATIILFLFLLLRRRQGTNDSGRLRAAAVFACGVLLTGTYWYLRNFIVTGNPIYPAQLGPFDGPFTAAIQHNTKLVSAIAAGSIDWPHWAHLIGGYTDWPCPLFLAAAVGYLATFCSLVRRKTVRRNTPPAANPSDATFLLFLIGSTLLLLFPFAPFSAITSLAGARLTIKLNYLIAPFVIGLVLFSRQLDGSNPRRWIWWLLAVPAIVIARDCFLQPFIVGILVAVLGWRTLRDIFLAVHPRVALTFSLLLAALVVGAMLEPYRQRLADVNRYAWLKHCTLSDAYRALEDLPRKSKIAWLGDQFFLSYPLLGRRLHLAPCPVNADGSPYVAMHEAGDPWEIVPHPPSELNPELIPRQRGNPRSDRLAANLIASGADYVIVTQWHGLSDRTQWPPQYRLLSNSPQAHPVFDDGFSAIFKLHKQSPAVAAANRNRPKPR